MVESNNSKCEASKPVNEGKRGSKPAGSGVERRHTKKLRTQEKRAQRQLRQAVFHSD